jgi:hypothetical protein
LGLILEIIFVVFLGPSCRETAKNAIEKNRRGKKNQLFWPKALHGLPQKVFMAFVFTPLVEKLTKTP